MIDDFENWLAGREKETPVDDGELPVGTLVGDSLCGVDQLLQGSGLDTSGIAFMEVVKVALDANGGTCAIPFLEGVIGMAVGFLPAAKREGWTFDGWFTAAEGGEQVTEATILADDVTYYAHWTKVAPVVPEPESIDPQNPGELPWYQVLNMNAVAVPYSAAKAVTLKGAAYYGGDVMGVVELKLGRVTKQKTSKVSGSFIGLDGKKQALKAVSATGIDGTAPATVSLDVKGLGTMTVAIGGGQFAGALGKWHVQSANVGGNWTKAGATVKVAVGDVSAFGGTVLVDLLPTNVTATVSRGKWAFAKAAGVKASANGLVVDTAKGKTNLSGIKLTYTPKAGTFKGSFKVYALEGAKLKKYTVSVAGVVVDGVGYGRATWKKPAVSWTVTVK